MRSLIHPIRPLKSTKRFVGPMSLQQAPESFAIECTAQRGMHSTLSEVITDFNFGVVHVQPTGNGAVVLGSVAHEGNAFSAGLDIADLILEPVLKSSPSVQAD